MYLLHLITLTLNKMSSTTTTTSSSAANKKEKKLLAGLMAGGMTKEEAELCIKEIKERIASEKAKEVAAKQAAKQTAKQAAKQTAKQTANPTSLPAKLDSEIQAWFQERGCEFENGKPILIPLKADGGRYTSYTLASKETRDYIIKEIVERRFRHENSSGWTEGEHNNEQRYHDPSADHIQKLFRLFETKADRTLTIKEILKEFGNYRHCKTVKHTNMSNEHYWKCILRELHKQYIVIRKC